LIQDNFGQKAIADKTRASFDVVQINLWGDRELTDLQGTATTEKKFAEQMRVMFTPTLLVLDEKGKQVLRLNGYYPPHKFDLALEYGAGRAGKGMKFSEFVAQAAPTAASGQINTQPFFIRQPYQFNRKRTAGARPLVVLFEQRECAACDEFHREVLARDGTRKWLERFDVAQLDLRANTPLVTPQGAKSTAREWARRLNVQYAPSLVFFDAKGHEVFRTEAYLRAFHVESALEYVASGAYRTQPNFQRFVQARADAARARGERVDIME
jgi:thioredoxin-related protein